VIAEADGLFSAMAATPLSLVKPKIDRSVSIVTETDGISNRRNSPLKSNARISDGSPGRFLAAGEKICGDKSARYYGSKQIEWE
jgi:hypothetical protein